MTTETLQVRDVPGEDLEVLRARAAAQNLSLSGYLRELIHNDASTPSMKEFLARIAARDPVEASGEDIRSLIEAGRR